MFFWYDEDGMVLPWKQGDFSEDDVREWTRWIDDHGVVLKHGVGLCLVCTRFVGKNIPGGMFFTEALDARGCTLECIQSLTINAAYRAHKGIKQCLEAAMKNVHGEYYPSRP